ncbi:MAG: hypothetical protein HY204_05955 [Nitrospirae bacterium]|nr:hypothetical protein [Nitrospirota bacterium]
MRPRAAGTVLSFLSLVLFLGCAADGDEAVSLTPEERQKITELVLAVTEDPQDTVVSAHEELWSILKKHGPPSERQIGRFKDRFLTIGEGHHLFWRDAREALRSRHRVKSPARVRWEERLEKDGWLSQKQRDRFDDLMSHVVSEEPISSNHGVEVSLSGTMVDEIVNSWDEQELERSVAYLLTPPN